MTLRRWSLGQTVTPFMTCPPCSYLWEGSCVVCQNGDPHPGCLDCEDGKPLPDPWYKSDLVISILAGSAVAIITGLIVAKAERWLGPGK